MDIPLSMVIGAAATVAGNIAAIGYLTKGLWAHRLDIKELYNKVNETMTKSEIIAMVQLCNEPIKATLDETKIALTALSKTTVNLSEGVARLDERSKILKEIKDASGH